MPVIVSAPEGESFKPIETGTYQAVCAEVLDIGMRESKGFEGKEPTMKHKIAIVWELSEIKDNGERFVFTKEYVASLHEKASLRKDLDAWRGVPFTVEDLKGFDVEKVVGANCMLTIGSYPKQNGDEGRKITAVGKVMKGLEKMAISDAYKTPKFLVELLGGGETQQAHEDDLPW